MKAGSVKEVLEPILDDLVRYTQEHFSAEEGLMLIHHYPGYMEHKAEHDAFIAKVLDFQKEYQKGSLALTLEVMNFLLEWVKSHIKVVDQRYGPYLSEKGVL
jgi:hemerythrin-like metal-binding protein